MYALSSVFIVSSVSLVGVTTLSFGEKRLKRMLLFLVSFAAGTLLGDAFIHLIPEAFEKGSAYTSFLILSGLLLFFALERFIHWRHCHDESCEEHAQALPYVILTGDGLHNFIDGMIIGASYLVSIPVGIATTLAVIFHEIPQEIGDFGALLYGGFSKAKAILWNFASALMAVIGAILVLVASNQFEFLTNFLIPMAAGGFIYVATADMIPELHKHSEKNIFHSIWQLVFIGMGIAMMTALSFIE